MRALIFAAILGISVIVRAEEPAAATPVPEVVPAPAEPPAAPAPEADPKPAEAPAPPPVAAPTPAPAVVPEVPKVTEKVASEKELVDDDGYVVRLSLPTEADVTAWNSTGIRIGLAYSYGHLEGASPAIDLGLNAVTIRALARVDQYWSLGVDFEYALASGSMTGLRYASTLLAVLNPWRSLAVGVGLGFGGLVLSPPTPSTVRPGTGAEIASVTFGPGETMGSCTGTAWVSRIRAEYQFVLGPLFSMGPSIDVSGQYTRCAQSIGRADRETGLPIQGRQWWFHSGIAAGWWVSWR